MSDVEKVAAPEPPKPKEVDKGVFVLEYVNFSGTGDMRGFSYVTPRYKTDSDEEVNASYRELNSKFGAKTIVQIINAALRSSLAVKARNELPKVAKEDKGKEDKIKEVAAKIEELRQKSPLLVSEEDATSYVPGVREVTVQGLLAKASKLYAEGAKLMGEGKTEEANAKTKEAMGYMFEAQKKAGFESPEPSEVEDEGEDSENETENEEEAVNV